MQPHAMARTFELKDGEDVVAELEWKKMFGTLAEGKSEDGSWTFKREGFLSPRVTVRVAGSEDNLATFKPNWKGEGDLEFADGRKFRWAQIDFWGNQWAFISENREPVVRFKPMGGFKSLFKYQSNVEIAEASVKLTELPLLALLGWYIMILMVDDSTSTIVTTSI